MTLETDTSWSGPGVWTLELSHGVSLQFVADHEGSHELGSKWPRIPVMCHDAVCAISHNHNRNHFLQRKCVGVLVQG